jgi:hypothetical protein
MSRLSWLVVRARGTRGRWYSVRAASFAVAAVLLGIASPARADLTIIPTFDSSLMAADQAAINTAISQYESTFTNNITVSIYFTTMSSGLGRSLTGIYGIGYMNFVTGLQNQYNISGNANQGTALANLPTGSNNPVNGTTALLVSSADGRALGYNTSGFLDKNGNFGGTYDGIVSLNTSITFPPGTNNGGNYSLIGVAQHEIDEVLGLGSDVGGTGFFANPRAEDLYRFGQNSTTRNYTTSGDNAWFSINGGSTSLVQFNQNPNGDYGDWHTGGAPLVQNAFVIPGATPTILTDGGAELTALNVIGYDIKSVPELSTLWLTGMGALFFSGYGWLRRKRGAGETVA